MPSSAWNNIQDDPMLGRLFRAMHRIYDLPLDLTRRNVRMLIGMSYHGRGAVALLRAFAAPSPRLPGRASAASLASSFGVIAPPPSSTLFPYTTLFRSDAARLPCGASP